ncbi:Uncharacterized conserved protein [Plasmopara halstedii]|uniref:Uncharacterized conserved protein n=1 Tax=Plasmopara halstedii TaxID=4781 RepID=A0A0P1ANF6_PLAHL|nr:Uncharacterized conserved protein [Plasmopara halstedii]CEG42303.1 Uncharacterized conserved protein [Plasmopara halstedii]|eukprot:XP_024578672.1 Uncharacterized conserved protein [Plasmopara halstedii]
MSAHEQEIELARDRIHDTTQKADSYLAGLTKRIDEYEKKHTSFEPAGKYLKSAIETSRSATEKLKTQGENLSEKSVPMALDGMHAVRESLDSLQQQTAAYDKKFAGSHGHQAVETLQSYAIAGRQHATDALETTNEQLMKLRDAIGNMAGQATHGAQVVVGEAVRVAEFGDEKLGVSNIASGVVQKVRDLDTRLGVTAVAAKVDATVTGGIGCKIATATVGMVAESVNYLSETLQNAKLAAQHSETAQSVEAKGSAVTGSVIAKKNEVQDTFSNAAEKGKEMIGMTTEVSKEKAGQTKELAEEKAGQASDKAREVTEKTKAKAGQAKGVVEENVEYAKGKGSEMTETSKDKAGQTQDTAKETINQAAEKSGEVTEAAKGKADHAKNGVNDKTDKVKKTV